MRLTDRKRARLVETLRDKGIGDERVLAAIGRVLRHEFVPDDGVVQRAYEDVALPIRLGQTISQPFTVATMTTLLDPQPGARVLEIGTGSGYQAAVLCELGARVFSVERHKPLLDQTRPTLERLGYRVRTRHGDGTYGWPGYAPYDGIVVTAGGPDVPPDLVDQLRSSEPGKPDARLIIPVGPPKRQRLHRITKTADGVTDETLDAVVFVPFVRDS